MYIYEFRLLDGAYRNILDIPCIQVLRSNTWYDAESVARGLSQDYHCMVALFERVDNKDVPDAIQIIANFYL